MAKPTSTAADDSAVESALPHPEVLGLPALVGQRAAVATLQASLVAQRPHHAYLFDGPEGVGKATCARALFAAQNCDNPPGPQAGVGAACGQCLSCQKVGAGTHPDLIRVDMSLSGLADEMERIVRRVQYPPFEGKTQLVLFDPADQLTAPTAGVAANRLLKTLEEPRPRTQLVLISAMGSALLPTLRSRCQRIRFVPLGEADMQRVLQTDPHPALRDLTPQTLAPLFKLAQGSLGALYRILDDQARYTELTAAAQHLYEAAKSGRASQMIEQAAEVGADREQALLVLDLLWLRLHDSLCTLVAEGRPVRTRERVIAALAATRAAQAAIRGHTGAPLSIERLLLQLLSILRPVAQAAPRRSAARSTG